eukprot:493056-Pyramimonas_sp.AAC.1
MGMGVGNGEWEWEWNHWEWEESSVSKHGTAVASQRAYKTRPPSQAPGTVTSSPASRTRLGPDPPWGPPSGTLGF